MTRIARGVGAELVTLLTSWRKWTPTCATPTRCKATRTPRCAHDLYRSARGNPASRRCAHHHAAQRSGRKRFVTRRRQKEQAQSNAAQVCRQKLPMRRPVPVRLRLQRRRADAQQARAEAADASSARAQAAEAQRNAQSSQQDAAAVREKLREQLNAILQTNESARGLIVNMNDVLFDTGRYTLKADADIKLAKIAHHS